MRLVIMAEHIMGHAVTFVIPDGVGTMPLQGMKPFPVYLKNKKWTSFKIYIFTYMNMYILKFSIVDFIS